MNLHDVRPLLFNHAVAYHALVFTLLILFSCHSSDVVWEFKPKKKNRWKTLNSKEAEMLEESYKEYNESGPVDHAIVDLENNFQVRASPTPGVYS